MRVLRLTTMSRHFRNTLPDHTQGQKVKIDDIALENQLKRALDLVLSDEQACRKPSVYTGGAGIAYAFARSLPAIKDPPSASEIAQHALNCSDAALEYFHQRPSGTPASLMFGEAGASLIAAFVANAVSKCSATSAADLQASALRHVERFLSFSEIAASPATHDNEFLYGKTGYLMGCLLIQKQVPALVIERLASTILTIGHHNAQTLPSSPEYSTPLWYEWHDSAYLGAAHGMMGILYVLLNVENEVLEAIPRSKERISGAVEYVMSLEIDEFGAKNPSGGEFPTRMGPLRDKEPLMHWCHGAVGAIFLFTQAEKVLGNGRGKYLKVAERAGEAIWRRGLLKKGPGLCHGISGNAYALLRLYKATGDEKWLHRALKFLDFMNSEEFLRDARTPDNPLSLYEGWTGAVCLYADLLICPKEACFPLFERRGGKVES